MLFTLVIAIGTFPYALRAVAIPWSLDQDSVHSEIVRLLFLQVHRETDRFFAFSGVQVPQPTSGLVRHTAFSSQIKDKVDNLVKAAALRINLNIDGTPIASKSHTHPSHSQTSRLLTSSLSLEV
jgi:hypothetical protein